MGYGRMIYPINAGQTESDFVDGNTYEYEDRNNSTIKGKAYHDVSVNPLLATTNLDAENNSATSSLVNSAIFTEIRKSPHGESISNDNAGLIGNRILPTTGDVPGLEDYVLNRDETHPYKVKTYDSTINNGEINRKFIYSTSDTPGTNETGLDIENYDYFILLNPEISAVGQGGETKNNTIRPHFAKITRIVAFDDFGDGVEFSPEYPTSVPINTKMWIFKGPAKTDIDVVAVSYGLRGDVDANTPKYDKVSVVSIPTFYFYNDRLDEKDHLDYATKYTLTSLRWYSYPFTIQITDHTAHDEYDIGSTSKYFEVGSTTILNKISEGQSVFDNAGNWLGNVEDIYTTLGNEYRFYLDYARRDIADDAHVSNNLRIGKTIQNVVFRTEYKFNSNIENLGKFRLDATLVDANKNDDDDDSSFDCVRWHKAFPNMHRHTSDLATAETDELDGNLTGPSKYLTFEKSQMKNDKVANIQDVILNSPRNRMTKMLSFTAFDNSGTQHLKVKNGEKIIVRNSVHNSSFKIKEIVGKVDKLVVGSSHSFVIREMEDKDIDLRSFLSADSIVLIDDYYYVINAITPKSNSTPLEQAFTIKAKRAKTANTWTVTPQGETISNKTMYVSPYTGVLNFEFVTDTEVDINKALVDESNNATGEYRITMNGNTVEKENTKLYNGRFTVGRFNSHVNEIDYSDRNNKYLKLKNDTRNFYQSTGRLMHYYTGDYVLHTEVFSGEIEDAEFIFANGQFTCKVSARDDISRMLTQVITKNLNYSKDIAMSCLTKLAIENTYDNFSGNATTSSDYPNQIRLSTNASFPSELIKEHTIITTSDNKLIGSVKDTAYDVEFTIDRITLYNNIPSYALGSHTELKYYRPFDEFNRITGLKAIQSNTAHTRKVSDYTSLSEKGIVFDKAIDLAYDGAGNTSTDFINTSLVFTSNLTTMGLFATGINPYISTKALGYDISSPTAISTDDSIFAFNIGNENGVTNTKTKINMLNSETFDILETETVDGGITILSVAPTFPVVLGRIDTNTSDSRGNCKIYMVNNNINTGGYIHRLQNIHADNYSSDDTIRYWDLQKFNPGGLTRTYDSIYSEGRTPQKLQGYAVGYGTYADGTPYTPTATISNKPLAGSNTLEGWTHLDEFYGPKPLIKSYYSNHGGVETDIMYSAFEQIDPRTIPYELFATGDIFPSSKLRWNSLFFHTFNFENFGITLEQNSLTTGSTTHQLYDGATQQTEKTDSTFENNTIGSANTTTNNIRRWGIARLVEATFDWHFNPIDFDALKPADEIPRVKNFEYVVMQKPTTDTGSITVASNNSVTTSGLTGTDKRNMFHDVQFNGSNTSEIDGVRTTNEINGFIAKRNNDNNWDANDLITGSTQIFGEDSPYDYLLRFNGLVDKYWGIESFRLNSSKSDYDWEHQFPPSSTNFQTKRQSGDYDIKFSNVEILRPNVNLGGGMLRYGYLAGDSWTIASETDPTFHAPNIFLPIIAELQDAGGDLPINKRFSPFHHSNTWHGSGSSTGETQPLHMSRVINALIERTFSNEGGTEYNIAIEDKFGMGISATTDDYFSHIYDNCIGLFREPNDLLTGEKLDVSLMSSQLELDSDTDYVNFLTQHNSVNNADQHSRTTMITDNVHYGGGGQARIGTKTKDAHIFEKTNNNEFLTYFNAYTNPLTTIKSWTNRVSYHDDVDNDTYGKALSAQFIVKPKFDLTEQNGVDVLASNKDVTFELGNTSKHSWLSFMPDLTGYYLVSENVTKGTLSKNCCLKEIPNGQPKYVGKITAHIFDTEPTASAIEKHKITLDTALDTTANGVHYRLMRFSETTFEDTPDKIEIGVMHDTGLQYNTVSQHIKTGTKQENISTVGGYNYYQESVYSMYLLLDIDNDNGDFMERRTISSSTVPSHFTEGEVIDTHITDGVNTSRKSITVNLTRPIPGSESTEYGLVFNYDGKLSGNGVVSFGEVFNINLNKTPKLNNPKKCHVGNTFSIGTQIEKQIQNIVTDAGLEYNTKESFSKKTNNVVNTISSSVITCVDAIENVVVGDILYSHDGHLVGKVSLVSGSNITFTKLYYTPLKYDELIKIEKKTFVTNLNLNYLDVYSALNTLVSKSGLDYSLKDGVFRTRNIDDIHSMRKYSLSALRDYDKIIEISSHKSLFDVYDKVIVIGDGITHQVFRAAENQKTAKRITNQIRTLRHTDLSINTESEARVKALELLDLHSDENLMIKLKLHKEGLELLEAGDILGLKFEDRGIPSDDYIVFEIENVLAGELNLIVGTFNKTIAERMVEIQAEETKNTIAEATENSEDTSGGMLIPISCNINFASVEYTITQSAENSNMGFDDLVGFTEVVGFEESAQTTDTYDSEDWTDIVEGL